MEVQKVRKSGGEHTRFRHEKKKGRNIKPKNDGLNGKEKNCIIKPGIEKNLGVGGGL